MCGRLPSLLTRTRQSDLYYIEDINDAEEMAAFEQGRVEEEVGEEEEEGNVFALVPNARYVQ